MNRYCLYALLIVWLSGCATSGLEMVADPDAEVNQKHLIIHNDSLASQVIITSVQTRTINNLLEANLTIKNLTSRDKHMQYRFSWFDADKFEVEAGVENWVPIIMHGAAEVNIKGLAPNETVRSFKLNVREQ